jgi:HD-GYP domain-containing protein (c-di-GMP phosphodiesterase class II)
MKERGDKLNDIIRLSIELNRIHDEDMILDKILHEARAITGADAGSIYIKKGMSLVFSHVQNDTIQKALPPGRKMPYTVFEIKINPASVSGYVANTGRIVAIDDVYQIPADSPYSFDPSFDKISNYKTTSMLTVPLTNNMQEVLGVLQLINAKDESGNIVPFDSGDEPLILHFASVVSMVLERAGMTRAMILRMIRMAELRDPKETGAHVNRVASYAVEIYDEWAKRKNIPDTQREHYCDLLRMAAMLHDVGKVAISDLILKKPSRFTEEEYATMKSHTWLGSDLFTPVNSELDAIARDVAAAHHENWDGSGYPGALIPEAGFDSKSCLPLSNEKIPIWGRIVAIADVYDALSSRRVYKEAWSEKDVLDEIRKESGKKFDPEIVEIFFDRIDNIRALREKYPDVK